MSDPCFIVEIGCYSLIMISISCGHLQIDFIGVVLMKLFFCSFSTSSVITLIKKVNSQNYGLIKTPVFQNQNLLQNGFSSKPVNVTALHQTLTWVL
ncbi:hypothetical protein MtrunA17_Chr8g0357731 [Medicago truncatula]|uniref:Transmembrane protein n=1 Tax=Medicago truncatula TaxID=3880 RepID=A0A396GHN9_MEDTR|nr:hypothetical protein MtrunA17_Chr8g0357731 [Medicago truncatula]